MALTKTTENDKIEVVRKWNIQVRTATVIKEDGTEISRTFHRYVLNPSTKTGSGWGDTDISGEEARVQAICYAVRTSSVKTAYQEAFDASIPE